MKIPQTFLQQIKTHAEKEYPAECCGLLYGPVEQPEKLSKIYACKNAQDACHEKDPRAFPRTAKDAYFIDPADLLAAQKSGRANQEVLRVIYHSHVDAGAYFSDEDEKMALEDGQPVYPETLYLVVAVSKGKSGESRLYGWNPQERKFQERPIEIC